MKVAIPGGVEQPCSTRRQHFIHEFEMPFTLKKKE